MNRILPTPWKPTKVQVRAAHNKLVPDRIAKISSSSSPASTPAFTPQPSAVTSVPRRPCASHRRVSSIQSISAALSHPSLLTLPEKVALAFVRLHFSDAEALRCVIDGHFAFSSASCIIAPIRQKTPDGSRHAIDGFLWASGCDHHVRNTASDFNCLLVSCDLPSYVRALHDQT